MNLTLLSKDKNNLDNNKNKQPKIRKIILLCKKF